VAGTNTVQTHPYWAKRILTVKANNPSMHDEQIRLRLLPEEEKFCLGTEAEQDWVMANPLPGKKTVGRIIAREDPETLRRLAEFHFPESVDNGAIPASAIRVGLYLIAAFNERGVLPPSNELVRNYWLVRQALPAEFELTDPMDDPPQVLDMAMFLCYAGDTNDPASATRYIEHMLAYRVWENPDSQWGKLLIEAQKGREQVIYGTGSTVAGEADFYLRCSTIPSKGWINGPVKSQFLLGTEGGGGEPLDGEVMVSAPGQVSPWAFDVAQGDEPPSAFGSQVKMFRKPEEDWRSPGNGEEEEVKDAK